MQYVLRLGRVEEAGCKKTSTQAQKESLHDICFQHKFIVSANCRDASTTRRRSRRRRGGCKRYREYYGIFDQFVIGGLVEFHLKLRIDRQSVLEPNVDVLLVQPEHDVGNKYGDGQFVIDGYLDQRFVDVVHRRAF
jgi:hypothetical protein